MQETTLLYHSRARITLVVVLLSCGLLLLFGVIVSIYFATVYDSYVNLFTILSGWLGFIATAGVGYFTLYFSKQSTQIAQMQRLFDKIEFEIAKIGSAQIRFAKESGKLFEELALNSEMWGHLPKIKSILGQTIIDKRGDILDLIMRDFFESTLFYEYRQETLIAVMELHQFILIEARTWNKDLDNAVKDIEKYRALSKKLLNLSSKYLSSANSFYNNLVKLPYKSCIKKISSAKFSCLVSDEETGKIVGEKYSQLVPLYNSFINRK